MRDLIGEELAGYRIEALIGKGGMGSVYRAEQRKLGRKVALKVLSAELAGSEEFRSRFLAESHTAAAIDHPNILPVYDAGEQEGLLYIAMRLVEGTQIDLQALLEREGALRPERALAIVAQVASALDAAHARGLVHRDVKPGNVLLAADHVYLTDFGIARATAGRRELTRTGAFVGTLDYASPEQIRNDAVDGASDIYSLGAVLFHCLTGKVPFDRPSEYGVMKAHLEEPPPAISADSSELPATLDAVFATAMAKERDERYRSGRHLVEAARAALEGRAAAVLPTVAALIAPVAATVIREAEPPTTALDPRNPNLQWSRVLAGALLAILVSGALVASVVPPTPPSPTPLLTLAVVPSSSPAPSATAVSTPTSTAVPSITSLPKRPVAHRPNEIILPLAELPWSGYAAAGEGFPTGHSTWSRSFTSDTAAYSVVAMNVSVKAVPVDDPLIDVTLFCRGNNDPTAPRLGDVSTACLGSLGGQPHANYNVRDRNMVVQIWAYTQPGRVPTTATLTEIAELARSQLARAYRLDPP